MQRRGSYAEALAHYERSLKIKEELGNRSGIAMCLYEIGNLHYLRGSYAEALAHYERSLKIEEELGSRSNIASSLGQMGQLLLQLGQYEDAFGRILSALSILMELQSPNAANAVNDLKRLRSAWGAEPFDAAWQEATGEPVPDELKEEEKPEG